MDELARRVKIARHELLPRLDIEIPEVFQYILMVDLPRRLLHLEHGLELTEAVKAELLGKADDGRR